jgi:hypothetical protein
LESPGAFLCYHFSSFSSSHLLFPSILHTVHTSSKRPIVNFQVEIPYNICGEVKMSRPIHYLNYYIQIQHHQLIKKRPCRGSGCHAPSFLRRKPGFNPRPVYVGLLRKVGLPFHQCSGLVCHSSTATVYNLSER